MNSFQMQAGNGSFQFSDPAAGTRHHMRVFYFRPASSIQDARIVIAMHGLDRAASDFRDVLVKRVDQHGMIVLVPEFDGEAFPDVYAYNYGNVRSAEGAVATTRDQWSFGIVDRLFQHVRDGVGSERATFGMFGNSAGSQFVLRYLALTEASAVDRAVASNSGIYMLPDLAVEYPSGMGGLDLNQASLQRYFGRKLTILLGEADSDSTAFDLPRDKEALAQGPHRLARGLWHFDLCKQIASRLGDPFAWTLRIVPGAGHVDQRVFDTALDILAG
ncbi:hypothetical protein MOV66_00775 [Agrobacterium sp. SHOUNA12C]|nr:hypothetical protein [Agrobacterium sp. BETTINA12B]MCJ9755168.1 hypothetical protein [Agrobacterium sp. SHOUNA12C]NTG36625.1 hypothetical protein [Rhizobium rhizogenes]NTG55876.1 hypothetical protein [Rhizobium rhizogenes]NTH01788.1 hypothetical protein [Rhizobium rhizogenes]